MHKNSKEVINNGAKFENIVKDIFQKSDYRINEVEGLYYDFIAERNNYIYFVETKYSLTNGFNSILNYVYNLSNKESISITNGDRKVFKNVLVISMVLTDKQREIICSNYNDLIVIDLANLLYITERNDEIRTSLLSILSFAIDDIVPKKANIELYCYREVNKGQELIDKLNKCKTGRKYYREFEDICCDCMKYLFSNALTLFESQIYSNDDLYRFDLICRVKNNSRSEFWSIVEEYFKSKYVIFEFKNYSEKIKQAEVYTTEKYLYKKAFRNVAIVVSSRGCDDNSLWAAKGSLRENGKLIMLINKGDVIEMIKKKENSEDPSEYLLEILDGMLIALEK